MKKSFSVFLLSIFLCSASFGAERIVTVGGTITEVVFGLGLGPQVVGVDATSIYPPEAQTKKQQLGYYRTISAEGVLSLKPSVVLMGSSSWNPQLASQLKEAGVNVEKIQEQDDLTAIPQMIQRIGQLIGAQDQAKSLIEKFNGDLKSAKDVPAPEGEIKAMFLYARSPTQVMVAGRDTPAQAMLEAAGLTNAFETVEGFKPVSSEALVQINPDLVIIQDNIAGLKDAIWDIPGMNLTKAGKARGVIEVRTLPFLGMGPRSAEELVAFKTKVKELVYAGKN